MRTSRALKAHFSEEEITKITVAIGTINVWNRLAVGFRSAAPDRSAGEGCVNFARSKMPEAQLEATDPMKIGSAKMSISCYGHLIHRSY